MQRNILSLIFCGALSLHSVAQADAGAVQLAYDFDHPAITFELPASLKEISGITPGADGERIFALQDELGAVYQINKKSGKIEQETIFEQDGDFEDIVLVGNLIVAVKSSGSVFLIEHCGENGQSVTKIKTGLEKTNNVEGATFDKKRNLLLLACKGNAGLGLTVPDTRAIYGFDLNTRTLTPEPVYTISRKDILQFLSANTDIHRWDKLNGLFAADKEEFAFCPSGIAIHPDGDVYILSSVGKMLLILNPEGRIKHLIKLEKEVHPQPEGIFFDSDGALYICNEGKEGPGLIHRFDD